MASTFALGSIPPLSAWEGEVLTFTLTSTLGSGTTFSKRASPRPKGKLTLDEKTGVFQYAPVAADREEFAVWIRARNGAKEEKQKLSITPHPRLPSDFNTIQSTSTRPDPSSPTYITYAEQSAGRMIFNNETDYGDEEAAKVETKQVTVSGVVIVLEANSQSYPLFDRLNNQTTIKRLTLCANEVVVRSTLNLPGTDLHIYANRLRFEDFGGQKGAFNTTPRAVTMRARTREAALPGQKGGNIYLYVGHLEMSGAGNRFITAGAAGQGARLGEIGSPGKSLSAWDGKATTVTWWAGNEELNWSTDFGSGLEGYTPVYAEIWEYYAPGIGGPWFHEFNVGTKSWPTDGEPPKILPGRPGQGGDGGSLFSDFTNQLSNRVVQKVGDAGKMADNVPATAAGTPVKSCYARAEYKKWGIPSGDDKKPGDGNLNRRIGLKILESDNRKQKRETKPGPAAIAPGVAGSPPKAGELKPLPSAEPVYWLTLVRAALPYANDAMLAGYNEDARALLEQYRKLIEAKGLEKGDQIEGAALHADVLALLTRIASPYDYFGNPAGWAPMLSFETNLKLYEREVEDAIRTLFLVYWMENTNKRQQSVKATLQEAIVRLQKESEQALADYDTAQGKLSDLNGQRKTLVRDIEQFTKDLSSLQKELRRQVANNLRLEHILRGSAKILGGVMQLIPVGQPVLGAFGKGVTVLSDIDLDKPLDSLPSLAGAFSGVVEEKLVPKVSKLFEGLKSAKTEEKDEAKEKFDKAIEKKKFAEKVKKHLDEQKEAKEQVTGAFSGFAVSEDEIDERLASVLAESPQYKELTEKVTLLNARKKAITEELLAVMETIDRSAATLIGNQLARLEIGDQLDATLERLNNEALQYARGMGQRARNRLLKYQYYLLKSYHYLMLQDMSGMDFRAQKMFDAFAKFLADSPNGMLTKDQFNTLKTVFEDQLKLITGAIIDWYQTHPPAHTGEFIFSLEPDQLETLNTPAGRLDLDLMDMGYLNPTHEDIRITAIEATTVKLTNPPPKQAVNVSLVYRHDGLSRLRRGGRLFLFRSGDYSVAADGTKQNEPPPTKYRDDHMFWATDVEYHDGNQTLKVREPDPAAISLLRHLIDDQKGKAEAKGSLLNFRPSAWGGITIYRSATPSTYAGKLNELVLRVKYVSQNVDDRLSTLFVKMAGDAAPLIQCDLPDVNGRQDGEGSFLRTFDKKLSPQIVLHAPKRYGLRDFLGWHIVGDATPSRRSKRQAVRPLALLTAKEVGEVSVPEDLIPTPDLKLDLTARRAYEVLPIFSPTSYVPVDDDDEKWPICPAGWEFIDWLLINKTKKTITIHKYDAMPWYARDRSPGVNNPVGNNTIKLSFERLVMAPEENTKISLCLNPAINGLDSDEIEFEFRTERGYGIFFTGKGKLSAIRTWRDNNWHDASSAFDIDTDERILTVRQ